ncbi:MAG: Tetratricopeptide TPR 2 repeat protein [Magnetococcales bacterium]|nr:Tetratricopeptide TPR 2 repeat protein [Magnetococcales bacterium]
MNAVDKKSAWRWLVVWGWVAVIFVCQGVWAGPRERVQEAVDSYVHAQGEGDPAVRKEGFRQAARLFKELLEEVDANADLYANLGAAALQGGDMGQAVLAFRRALLLDPGHERSRINLHHAREMLPSWVPRPVEEGVWDSFLSWWRVFSVAQRSAWGGVCFLLAAGGIAVAVRFGSLLARYVTLLPVLLWLLIVTQGFFAGEGVGHGVIIQEETLARAADSINAPASFANPLPAGTEVEVMDRREDWTRILLANGRNTWIRSSALAMTDTETGDKNH